MKLKLITIALLSYTLSSCAVYKMEVQQGNALTSGTVAQLQRGMSKDQVAALMGSPLLQDNFRGGNRWDYVYYQLGGNNPTQKQNLTLFFQNDQLVSVKK